VIATVYTSAATNKLVYSKQPGRGWAGADGGAVLAFLVFMGIPARRRSWRSMLGILIVMAALGSMAACGGSFSVTGVNTGTLGTTSRHVHLHRNGNRKPCGHFRTPRHLHVDRELADFLPIMKCHGCPILLAFFATRVG